MTEPKFTQADIDAVSDSPELTAVDLASAVPFDQAFPKMAAAIRRGRGPQKAPRKELTTIRLSSDVIAHFKRAGQGWQSRIDAALKDWMAGRG